MKSIIPNSQKKRNKPGLAENIKEGKAQILIVGIICMGLNHPIKGLRAYILELRCNTLL